MNLTKRLEDLERRASTQHADSGRYRAILADRIAQMATRMPTIPTGAESLAQRLVAEALASGNFWPAISRSLRAYLDGKAA
jgi:hypothetical protein